MAREPSSKSSDLDVMGRGLRVDSREKEHGSYGSRKRRPADRNTPEGPKTVTGREHLGRRPRGVTFEATDQTIITRSRLQPRTPARSNGQPRHVPRELGRAAIPRGEDRDRLATQRSEERRV